MAIKIDKQKLAALAAQAQEEASIVSLTLKEKGAGRFGRAIGLGVIAVAICHQLIYTPPQKKLKGLAREIAQAKTTAQYADQYKDLRDRLAIVFSFLPPPTALESRWLETVVMDSMKIEDISTDSVVPPVEQKMAQFTIQKQTVSTQLKFSELINWLNRLEATKPMVHIGDLEFNKKADPLGTNAVNIEIGTVVPLQRPGQP